MKMIMGQASLRQLDLHYDNDISPNLVKLPFTTYAGASDCLRNLSELSCRSDFRSLTLHRLSQLCRNIQSLSVTLGGTVSDGLLELISVQERMKHLKISYHKCSKYNFFTPEALMKILPSLTKMSNCIIEFDINLPFLCNGDIEILLDITFPKLQVLTFKCICFYHRHLSQLLKKNGESPKQVNLLDSNDLSNLSITEFCPNLKFLSIAFKVYEIKKLKVVLDCCKRLEILKLRCGEIYLHQLDILRAIAPEKFHELRLDFGRLHPRDLESALGMITAQ